MPLNYNKFKVEKNTEISKKIYRLTINGKFDAVPGQFYMLRAWDRGPFLSRPISIHDINDDGIAFLYEVRGEGTRLLSSLKHDSEIELFGPLGNGFDIDKISGKVAIVSGGIGIAPMFLTAKELKKRGIELDIHMGFRNKTYMLDEFRKYADKAFISTESGMEGHNGYVTDNFIPGNYDIVLCCGSETMMKKVTKMCIKENIEVYVSMEKKMACGIGACLGCICKTKIGNRRTCKDGPVFNGRDVIYA